MKAASIFEKPVSLKRKTPTAAPQQQKKKMKNVRDLEEFVSFTVIFEQ